MQQLYYIIKLGFREGVHTLGFGRSWGSRVRGSGFDGNGRVRFKMESLGPSGRSCRRADLVGSTDRPVLSFRSRTCRPCGDLGVLPVRVLASEGRTWRSASFGIHVDGLGVRGSSRYPPIALKAPALVARSELGSASEFMRVHEAEHG